MVIKEIRSNQIEVSLTAIDAVALFEVCKQSADDGVEFIADTPLQVLRDVYYETLAGAFKAAALSSIGLFCMPPETLDSYHEMMREVGLEVRPRD